MRDLFLKFPDQATAESILYTATEKPVFQLVNVEGQTVDVWVYHDVDGGECTFDAEPAPSVIAADGLVFVRKDTVPKQENQQTGTERVLTPKYRNIDVLGTIYERAPDPVPEDYEPVPLSGFHVNVRVIDGEDASVLEPYLVIPTNPRRIWWS